MDSVCYQDDRKSARTLLWCDVLAELQAVVVQAFNLSTWEAGVSEFKASLV